MCPKAYAVKKTMIKHFRRRHGFNGTECMKDYYNRLDPRECNLGLDEEIMTKLFGPPKKITNQVTTDVVTVPSKNLKRDKKKDKIDEDKNEEVKQNTNSKTDSEDEKSEKDNAKEGQKDGDVKTSIVKVEMQEYNSDQGENELEPTDFVSVKIEPMDDEEMVEN